VKNSGVALSKLSPAMQAQAMAQLHPTTNGNKTDHLSPAPVVERSPRQRTLATPQIEKGHSRKCFVRVVSYRCRLLDEDNLCEKYHVDALRYAGLISADSPDLCRIETTQQKVAAKADERTEITITYP
jgi:hypothetical protein